GDVAGNARIDFDVILALKPEKMPDLEGLARIADEELGIAAEGALVDAEDALFSDEGIDLDLEDMGENVHFGVGLGMELFRLLAFALNKKRRVAFLGIGHELDENVEQLGNACAGARRGKANRHQMPF